MASYNPIWTPVDSESKLGIDGDPVVDLTLYHSITALKRILRYVCGTLDFGIQLYASSTGSLVAYSDADWAGCPSTRRSTSGYVCSWGINFSHGLLSGNTLSRSSVEAEYRGVANIVAETSWLRIFFYADIFTNGLPSALFEEFRTSLRVRSSLAQTAGEC
ncbi:ribonuclease H-like domain-containing protein [Tanacetum coccineum]